MPQNSTKKHMEWFLKLINTDFENVPINRQLDLLNDMHTSFGYLIHKEFTKLQQLIWGSEPMDEFAAGLESTFSRLKDKTQNVLEEIINKYQTALKYEGEGDVFSDATPTKVIELTTLYKVPLSINATVSIRNKPKREKGRDGRKGWVAYWPDKKLTSSPIELNLVPDEENDDAVIFHFIQALIGLPTLGHIKKCHAVSCDKWLLQSGGKDRLFCSDRCRSREYNRQKRKQIKEEGGEKYTAELEAGNKRAKASRQKRNRK